MSYQMHFLFVSDRHAWKSQIAAALLNYEDGTHFVGHPTAPCADLPPDSPVVALMNEIGIAFSPVCMPDTPASVDRIIALDDSSDTVPAHECWSLPATEEQRVEAMRVVRDHLHRKVRELIRTA